MYVPVNIHFTHLFVDIPREVDNYHNLFPLEPPPTNPMHKSSTFGYPTTSYRATNTKDGLNYCLRRIHGFRLSNNKCIGLIDLWKKIQHSNIVQLREVFTTKAFGDHCKFFLVYMNSFWYGISPLWTGWFNINDTHIISFSYRYKCTINIFWTWTLVPLYYVKSRSLVVNHWGRDSFSWELRL